MTLSMHKKIRQRLILLMYNHHVYLTVVYIISPTLVIFQEIYTKNQEKLACRENLDVLSFTWRIILIFSLIIYL